ncbi:MAG: glycoside hydrolase family 31 protein [Myxococcales bacterium]|nr:glycoside hydrolase family 31 protein [Myxococcales bacterium]
MASTVVLVACQSDGQDSSDTDAGSTSESAGTTASGSGSDSTDTDSGTDTSTSTEPATFALICDEAGASLVRDDEALLRLPQDAFMLGVVDAIDDDLSYDPAHDLDVQWLAPTTVECEPDGPTLRLTYDAETSATVAFEAVATGRFAAKWTTSGATVAAFRVRARVDASEGFYGLGEVFDTPSHRGKVRALQLEPDFSYESQNNEAHVPVPLLIGTRGWGVFIEDPHPGVFAVATEAADVVEITMGVGADGVDGLAFHLYGAEHPLDIPARYYATTAWPITPAPWALGPWIWRNENDDQAQVLADAEMIRSLDLATSALWIDRPYATGVNTFDFDPARYPDPAAMIAQLRALGFRLALWHTPYVSNKDEPAPALYDEALMSGYFPPAAGLVLNGWGLPIDLSNADAYDWWQSLLASYTEMGIEGFKLDYGEDVLAGLGAARLEWSFADGSDEHTMHSRYQLFYHRAYAELLPPEGGFLLARGGTYGDQANVSVIWPGDLDADLSHAGDAGADGLAVGGLPAAVAAGLSLGPSGFPCFASDTGGYRHSPPDKETFTRWFQHTALSVVMQVGTGASDVAWEGTVANGFDDEMLGWYREFARLHLRLFPYLWTHLQRVGVDGRPIMRALGLAYPELGVHPPDVYLLGDDLLVAPVVDAGATTRTLTAPPGVWVDWFDGSILSGGDMGGETVTVDAPLSKLPLWLREGGIVPLLRPTIDTLSPTTAPASVDSYATAPGVLYPRVVPGPASSVELFDGGELEQSWSGAELSLHVRPGSIFVDGAVFEVMTIVAPPVAVTLDGAPLPEAASVAALDGAPGWVHTGDRGGTLWVRLPPGDHEALASF